MATSLQRAGMRLARIPRSSIFSMRSFASEAEDSLVEVRPGEIGLVSGIPEEHLRRRVCHQSSFCIFDFEFVIWLSCFNRFLREFVWRNLS